MKASATPKLHFVVPVWGEAYVDTFLNYCLPAQLAPKNICGASISGVQSYVICTRRTDYERIAASAAFQALCNRIQVDVEFLDDELALASREPGAKYDVKSNCYRRALRRAGDNHWAVVALNADIVFANGFVESVIALLADGKRVIEIPGPRALREPVGAALRARYLATDNVSISIEPIELSALWFANIHPLLDMHFVDGPPGQAFHPSHLYWRVAREGIVMRGFHLYPIVVVPGTTPINFQTTIDDDLVVNMQLSEAETFLADDSRKMFCCELSPADAYVGRITSRGQVDRYVDFYHSYAEANVRNLEKEILISGVAELGAEWSGVRNEAAAFVRMLLRKYRIGLAMRRVRDFQNALRSAVPPPVKLLLRRLRGKLPTLRR